MRSGEEPEWEVDLSGGEEREVVKGGKEEWSRRCNERSTSRQRITVIIAGKTRAHLSQIET